MDLPKVSRFDIEHNLADVVAQVNMAPGPKVLPVPGAGYGLFADRDYKPDGHTIITHYGGEKVPAGSEGDYIVEVGKDYDIDGFYNFDIATEKGRWINDVPMEQVNVRFQRKAGRIRIVPIKFIRKGEQILWNYGPYYKRPWLNQCIACGNNASYHEKHDLNRTFCSRSCQMNFYAC